MIWGAIGIHCLIETPGFLEAEELGKARPIRGSPFKASSVPYVSWRMDLRAKVVVKDALKHAECLNGLGDATLNVRRCAGV